MSWEQVVTLIGIAGTLCAIIFGVAAYRRNGAHDSREDATRLARIEGKLDSANRGIEDMRVDMRAHGSQIADHAIRIAKCEESIKNAHHRIDKIEHDAE